MYALKVTTVSYATVLLSYLVDILRAYEKAQPQLVLILFLKSGQNPGSCFYEIVLIKKECSSRFYEIFSCKLRHRLFRFRYLTSVPRVAGTPENRKQAEWIAEKFKDFGFDKVEIKKYTALLSYPTKPGSVGFIDEYGNIEDELISEETIYNKYENSTNALPPFIAFSKSGTVEVSGTLDDAISNASDEG